jgi:hypothetical protein
MKAAVTLEINVHIQNKKAILSVVWGDAYLEHETVII